MRRHATATTAALPGWLARPHLLDIVTRDEAAELDDIGRMWALLTALSVLADEYATANGLDFTDVFHVCGWSDWTDKRRHGDPLPTAVRDKARAALTRSKREWLS